MSYPTNDGRGAPAGQNAPLLALALLFASAPALGQQNYVSRYDLFAGYTFLDSPHVSLFENGFHFQAGVRPKTWYSLGFDYSISSGSLTLTPNLLTTAVQQQLGGLLQGLAAAGATPCRIHLSRAESIPSPKPSRAGRNWRTATSRNHPLRSALRRSDPRSRNPPACARIRLRKQSSQQLAPSGKKTDWTIFYGFGGGADFLFSKHVGLRVQADLVYDHLFNDLLQDGRFTTRFSVGPCFNFGKNIAK